MAGAVKGNLGVSLHTGKPVISEIARTAGVTVELVLLSIVLGMFLGIPLGVICAMRQNTWVDYLCRLWAIGGLSLPFFWIGILLLLGTIIFLRWMPPLAYEGPGEDLWINLQMMILPTVALGWHICAPVLRMTRSCMLEVLGEDYIRTARSKGLQEVPVMYRHAMKNAMLPVITIIGLISGTLMGGTVLLENIFALPGLGRLLISSITFRDYPMVQAIMLFFAAIFVFVNLATDIAYAWLDPRIHYA
jgi:peptide/nickel transport system permease protein